MQVACGYVLPVWMSPHPKGRTHVGGQRQRLPQVDLLNSEVDFAHTHRPTQKLLMEDGCSTYHIINTQTELAHPKGEDVRGQGQRLPQHLLRAGPIP